MFIGRVSGTVVATIKHPLYDARKLLVVDKLDLDGKPTPVYTIAVDLVRAGVGDLVLVLDEGNSARQLIDQENAPIRACIVGVIDEIDLAPA
jgi:ethanolamine utilization protein EutN